jgi:hypothetical protein
VSPQLVKVFFNVCLPGSPVVDGLGGSIVFARNEGMSISVPLEHSEKRLPELLRAKNALIISTLGLYDSIVALIVACLYAYGWLWNCSSWRSRWKTKKRYGILA